VAKILIGCPVYKREYVLPLWLDAIVSQTWPLKDIGFVFEAAPNDEGTHNILLDFHAAHPELQCFDLVINSSESHTTHPPHGRTWNHLKYYKMCRMRNNLLDKAIAYDFDRFFSLDSDILLEDKTTLSQLFTLTEERPAVSPLSYMFPVGFQFPSVMSWVGEPGGRAKRMPERYPIGEVFKADIIMAAVMMRPEVFGKVRYLPHRQGEDLGWSFSCASHGFDLHCASNIYCPHIMHEAMVEEFIRNGDIRSPIQTDKLMSD